MGNDGRWSQVLVVDPDTEKLLLVRHKLGELAGSYTALLGEVAPEESAEAAAVRLALEQCDLTIGVELLELRAILSFTGDSFGSMEGSMAGSTEGSTEGSIDEYQFYTERHVAELRESDAHEPHWFGFHEIPFAQMPADDAIWYPPFLEGKKLNGHFHFKADGTTLEHYEIQEVDTLGS